MQTYLRKAFLCETFEIPKGAIRLAESKACRNQMYQIGKNVLGFQFHPEMTPAALKLLLENEEELSIFSGEYVQSTRELEYSEAKKFEQGNQLLNKAIEFVINT